MSLPWVEKYRPQTTAEIVSHERIKSQINAFIDQNALPNLLFHGPAGVGKTTLIKSIARQMFGPAYQNQIIEINASDENGIDVVRDKISAFVKTKQLFQTEQKTKLVVLDECDQMSSVAQGALRRIIELSAGQARFCLICNYISKVIPPLQSRCAVFRFRPVPKEQCIEMLQRVALAEAISCDNQTLNAVYEVGCGLVRYSSQQIFIIICYNERCTCSIPRSALEVPIIIVWRIQPNIFLVQFNNNVKINHYFIFCFSLSIALGVIIVENNRELHSIDGSRVKSIAYFIMNNILQTY
ncbi:Replication_factor C [Hexamita inflata]|uniref:Subunit 3 n=1 Tax=Hexamita inflata TaxID=28002 RepID=A0AA86NRR2_9EUKA|nr:Replication factor C [Hexamita inflata]CAI9924833.1 Replication factor C [Hexamita inflata]